MAIYLEKLASEVEDTGLSQGRTGSITKIASAASAIKQLGMRDIPTILAGAAALTLGTQAVGKGLDLAGKGVDDIKYEFKKEHTILPFAKKENPGLKHVSDVKLGRWLDSARAMAPKVAKDKMLASTYLNNVHALGGQVDLHTASTLSEIGRNTSSHGGMADAIGGNMSSSSSLITGGA